jgi:hypothetical protein
VYKQCLLGIVAPKIINIQVSDRKRKHYTETIVIASPCMNFIWRDTLSLIFPSENAK